LQIMDVEQLIARGEGLEQEGRFEEASRAYERARDAGAACASSALRLRALRRIARLRRATGDLESATRLYREAFSLAGQLGEAAELAAAVTGLGNVSTDQGRWDEAQEHYRAGLEHALPLGDPLQIGQLWNNLSMVRRRLGDLDGALEASARAIEMLEEVGDRNELARCLNHLGLTQVELGRYPAALNSYKDAATLADDAYIVAAVHTNFCDLWLRMNRDRLEPPAPGDESDLASHAGSESEAALASDTWAGLDGSQQAQLGADLARPRGFPLILAHIQMEQGALCRLRRDPAGAELFERALETARRHEYRHLEAEVRLEYGLFLRDTAQPQTAARHFRAALDIYRRAGAQREAARVEGLLRELEGADR